ncbi:MAG TPA: hypothetical protein VEM13_08240 [Gemmatimonadales bacterium]|nr:hypothetical protein [Gemmatimonadales bacterium]
MSLIKRAPRVSGLCAALMLAAGCESLNITNPNAPDSKKLLSDPSSVQSLAVGAMQTWYNTFENIDPGTTLSVMARSGVAAWNNFQIRFYTGCTYGTTLGPMPAPYDSLGTCGTKTATYPRVEWQNDPTSTRRLEIETYWYGYYAALSSASDVLKAIRVNGLVITDATTTKMVETMAVLVQALCLSELALNYDKGFIVDYTTDLTTLQFAGRTAMRDAALAKFGEASALASANTFTVDKAFFDDPGVPYDNVAVAQIANTMAARTLAYFARDSVENKDIAAGGQVDWARVKSYTDSGMSSTTTSGGLAATPFDWIFQVDGCINWCDGLKNWSNDMTTMRVHTRVAHLLDPTTQPDPWKAVADSQPIWLVTSFDKRLGDGSFGPVGQVADTTAGTPPATANAGTDFAWSYNKEIQFTARGSWHQSAMGRIRYIKVAEAPMNPDGLNNGIGPAPAVLAAENDLLKAEALIRGPSPDLAAAATLINKTRVTRGGLSASPSGNGVLADLLYEQDVELYDSNVQAYYNQRRIDNLEPLTPHEFPVPAQELGVLGVPLYTFGGASNPLNSAPTAPAPSAAALVGSAPQIFAQIQREQRARMLANRVFKSLAR